MLPPFLGMLLTLATAGVLALALLGVFLGLMRGHRAVLRTSLGAGLGMAGLYLMFFGLGLLLAKNQILRPGQAVRFCGLDCHLHVAIDAVHPSAPGSDGALGVVVRFSSNAVRAPEWPRDLDFQLRDSSGHAYRPLNSVPDSALGAGQTWTHELRFPESVNPQGASLVVTWKPGLDYLVPGAGNPLVQRRTALALQ